MKLVDPSRLTPKFDDIDFLNYVRITVVSKRTNESVQISVSTYEYMLNWCIFDFCRRPQSGIEGIDNAEFLIEFRMFLELTSLVDCRSLLLVTTKYIFTLHMKRHHWKSMSRLVRMVRLEHDHGDIFYVFITPSDHAPVTVSIDDVGLSYHTSLDHSMNYIKIWHERRNFAIIRGSCLRALVWEGNV